MKLRLVRSLGATALVLAASSGAAAQKSTGRVIRGSVYDSLDARPLGGAEVTLLDQSDPSRTRSTRADSSGNFEFSGVPGGDYLIGFEHPLLDSLGITARLRQIELAATGEAPLAVRLAVPGARTVHDAFCSRGAKDDSTSVLIGHLSNANTRGVVDSGVVTAQWLAIVRDRKTPTTAWPTVTASSRADGSYVLCGLPGATRVAVQATGPNHASAILSIVTPPSTSVLRREVYLVDSAAARVGTITGLVRTTDTKKPIARAQVRVRGEATVVTTGADGRFSLRDVPYGTLTVGVRSLGFVPQEQAVDVLADASGQVTFAMAPARNVLDTIRTYAARQTSGFELRRKAGWGTFFDADAIQREGAWDVNDVVRGAPGVTVTGLGFDAASLMRNLFPPPPYCLPSYYLDGKKLPGIVSSSDLERFLRPDDLAGVEVYANPVYTPPQFREIMATCGSIVLWTRQGEQRGLDKGR